MTISRAVNAFDRVVRTGLWQVLSALVLSLLSAPLVSIAIANATVPPVQAQPGRFPAPLDAASAMPIALVAVIAAGIAGGAVGGRFVRRSPVAGLIAAVSVAWAVAIVTLPLVPTLRSEAFATGFMCLDGCSATILGGELQSGLVAYVQSVPLGAVLIVPPVLACVFLVLTWYARRLRVRVLVGLFALATVASLDFVSIWEGWRAFALLVGGAVLWVVPYWRGLGLEPVSGEPKAWTQSSGPDWGRPTPLDQPTQEADGAVPAACASGDGGGGSSQTPGNVRDLSTAIRKSRNV
jgi:hypothetical protein